MNNKIIAILGIALLVFVSLAIILQKNQNLATQTNISTDKVITVNGGEFFFNPKEIRVKQGQRIQIVFNNSAGFHDFVIDELNVRTKQISAGQSDTVEFIADKKGTFEFYCSVGSHRAKGMIGNIIVE